MHFQWLNSLLVWAFPFLAEDEGEECEQQHLEVVLQGYLLRGEAVPQHLAKRMSRTLLRAVPLHQQHLLPPMFRQD